MVKPRLRVVSPTSVVTPRRPKNKDLRSREHLTEHEVLNLVKAAKGNRWGLRDSAMIMVAFLHGLRVSELVSLKWDQVDFTNATLTVNRVKNGTPATHFLTGTELRTLRRLKREQEPPSPFVFVSERGAPFTTAGFARMLERAGRVAGYEALKVHPHMLRHATGHKLVNDGVDTRSLQAFMGHKCIQHTVRYTELSPNRFKNFWRSSAFK